MAFPLAWVCPQPVEIHDGAGGSDDLAWAARSCMWGDLSPIDAAQHPFLPDFFVERFRIERQLRKKSEVQVLLLAVY